MSNQYHIDSYLRRAYLLHRMGSGSEAMRTLDAAEAACRVAGRREKVDVLRAYINYESGEYNQAITIIESLSQGSVHSVYLEVLHFAAQYRLAATMGNPAAITQVLLQAKDYCRSAVQLEKLPPYFFRMLTVVLVSLGEISGVEAASSFKSVAISCPEPATARINMGLLYLAEKETAAALACFQQYR